MRQLSLLRAEQAMRPLNGSTPGSRSVAQDQSLREALSILLKIVAGSIMVALLAAVLNWSLQYAERRLDRVAQLEAQ